MLLIVLLHMYSEISPRVHDAKALDFTAYEENSFYIFGKDYKT